MTQKFLDSLINTTKNKQTNKQTNKQENKNQRLIFLLENHFKSGC